MPNSNSGFRVPKKPDPSEQHNQTYVRFDAEAHKWLRDKNKQTGRPITEIVQMAVRFAMDNEEDTSASSSGKTKKA